MIGSNLRSAVRGAGQKGVVGKSIERTNQTGRELVESEDGLRRKKIGRYTGDLQTVKKIVGSLIGRERIETNPGGNALFEREERGSAELAIEIVVT
jgi:hypothetical protein